MGLISLIKKFLFIIVFISALGYATKYIGNYNKIANSAETKLTGYAIKNVVVPIADKIFEKAHSLEDQSTSEALAEIKSDNPAFATKTQFIARKTHFNNQPGSVLVQKQSSGNSNQNPTSSKNINNPINPADGSNNECCKCS